MKKDVLASAGAVASALASSACCWLPLLLFGLGASGVGIAALFARFRFVFLGSAAGLLALAFYLNYRRQEVCRPDGSCVAIGRRTRRVTRAVLWVSTVLVVTFALFPGCVERVRPPFGRSLASASDAALVEAVENAGYHVQGSNDSTAAVRLSGEWAARFVVAEGETVDVVVDLDRLPSRWAGEFDVLAFGAENYPVEVDFDPPSVRLHFSGIDADFDGTLSATEDVVRGVAKTIEHEHPLVFRRVGDARFSETFRQLEAAADDSTRVRTLSADAAELRERFNETRGQVRLILLLSPT